MNLKKDVDKWGGRKRYQHRGRRISIISNIHTLSTLCPKGDVDNSVDSYPLPIWHFSGKFGEGEKLDSGMFLLDGFGQSLHHLGERIIPLTLGLHGLNRVDHGAVIAVSKVQSDYF